MYINGSSLPNLPDGWKEVSKQMSAVTDGSKVQQPYSEAMDNVETDHVLPGNIFVSCIVLDQPDVRESFCGRKYSSGYILYICTRHAHACTAGPHVNTICRGSIEPSTGQ